MYFHNHTHQVIVVNNLLMKAMINYQTKILFQMAQSPLFSISDIQTVKEAITRGISHNHDHTEKSKQIYTDAPIL